jgi:hypothetical protein
MNLWEPSRRHQAPEGSEPNGCLLTCFEVALLCFLLLFLVSFKGPLF